VVPGDDGRSVGVADDAFWRTIMPLADDNVIDVRIGVARLVGVICGGRHSVCGRVIVLIYNVKMSSCGERNP
jgi:hypothetical protein